MKIEPQKIALFNQNLRYEDPATIIDFALGLSNKPVLTTSFGPYSASLIHAVHRQAPGIKVLWCDTGYNTPQTYAHMHNLQERFNLDLEVVAPKYTTAYLDHMYGKPNVGTPEHEAFSSIVKIDPIKEAMSRIGPDLWFTNIRQGQTTYRDDQDVLSLSEHGILKVSPFYHFDNKQLYDYLMQHRLPAEFDYHDPVKAVSNRECGIHLSI